MLRKCCVCNLIYGEKEPYDDLSFTSGYCPKCYPVEIERLEQEIALYRRDLEEGEE